MEDALSDILRLIRLKSCLYFVRDFCAPWGMRIDGGSFAQFHVIVRGSCVVEAGGRWYHGEAGDVFLFPRGLAHVLADQAGRDAVAGAEVMRSFGGAAPYFSEGGKPTQLICGHFSYRDEIRHPLIVQLPEVIHITAFDARSPGAVDSVLPLLIREMKEAKPGTASIAERLAEVLLVQVLRLLFTEARRPEGFLAGLADPQLSMALRQMHGAADRKLTLDSLATSAGMSRSAFALRFKERLGLSPIEYLAKWRMYRASELLQGEGLSLGQVASRVGYESEIAFSRAFKREFAVSPGAYRRRRSHRRAE